MHRHYDVVTRVLPAVQKITCSPYWCCNLNVVLKTVFIYYLLLLLLVLRRSSRTSATERALVLAVSRPIKNQNTIQLSLQLHRSVQSITHKTQAMTHSTKKIRQRISSTCCWHRWRRLFWSLTADRQRPVGCKLPTACCSNTADVSAASTCKASIRLRQSRPICIHVPRRSNKWL